MRLEISAWLQLRLQAAIAPTRRVNADVSGENRCLTCLSNGSFMGR